MKHLLYFICILIHLQFAYTENVAKVTCQKLPEKNASSYYLAGELTMVDHVIRTGVLRPDRTNAMNKYHQDLPHPFELLPYSIVYRHGSQAPLKHIALGQHLHSSLFLSDLKHNHVELPHTIFSMIGKGGSKLISPDAKYKKAYSLEDDFSFYENRGYAWEIMSVDYENKKFKAKRVEVTKKIPHDAHHGLSGEQTFSLTEATKYWKGRGFANYDDLKIGQKILFNLTWSTIYGPGRCTDIWLDRESIELAKTIQSKATSQYFFDRGLPAMVNSIDYEPDAKGNVTITLYEGIQPDQLAGFIPKKSMTIIVVDRHLRNYDQNVDRKAVTLNNIIHQAPTQLGSSGIQLTFHMSELLEGIRPGESIRIFPHQHQIQAMPREERIWPTDVRSALHLEPEVKAVEWIAVKK